MVDGQLLPIADDVRRLFADLLGRSVAVHDERFTAPDDRQGMVASYVTDADEVGTLAVLDLALTCRLGAALMLVPAAVANESVADGDLSPMLAENAHEVVNIAAGLLNSPTSPHLRLARVFLPGDELGAEEAALLAAPRVRRDFLVEIDGYGDGRLSFAAS